MKEQHGTEHKLTGLHQVRFVTKTHGTRFHTVLHPMTEGSKMVHVGLPAVFLGPLLSSRSLYAGASIALSYSAYYSLPQHNYYSLSQHNYYSLSQHSYYSLSQHNYFHPWLPLNDNLCPKHSNQYWYTLTRCSSAVLQFMSDISCVRST
jgi:hypothetical protein